MREDKVLAPYNDTLIDKSEDEKKDWSNNVLSQLKDKVSLENDEFVNATPIGLDFLFYLGIFQ